MTPSNVEAYVWFNENYYTKDGRHNMELIRQYGVGPHPVLGSFDNCAGLRTLALSVSWTRKGADDFPIVCNGVAHVSKDRVVYQPSNYSVKELEEML
jgi:hypothetical protein